MKELGILMMTKVLAYWMKILMKSRLALNPHCLFKLEAMGKQEAVEVHKIGAKEPDNGDN